MHTFYAQLYIIFLKKFLVSHAILTFKGSCTVPTFTINSESEGFFFLMIISPASVILGKCCIHSEELFVLLFRL